MIILLWVVHVLLFILALSCLFWLILKDPYSKQTLQILVSGFKKGLLKGSGLSKSKRKYPVELWKWESTEDDHTCEDCLQRTNWPAMDIADWMKKGLPRTPEADTQCKENCRCELVPCKPNLRYFRKYYKK